LHALFVPARSAPPPPKAPPVNHEAAASTEPELQSILRGRIFWGLAVWFTAANATASGFVFQFVPLLTAWGVEMAAILTGVALIGPMQVAGRIVLMGFSARLATREIGTAVAILLPDALYGAGNGVMTIARGTAVADLIGRTHYGAINGALTLPTMVAKALAPVVTAVIWSATGDPSLMLWTLLGSALVGAVGFVFALSGTSPQTDNRLKEA
jgi:hypothetical protein